MSIERETALRERFPDIAWDEPIAITTDQGSGFECRTCVALRGKRGTEPPTFADRESARAHIADAHR